MSEIVTEHSDGVLRIELNRPTKRNAMTSSMYTTLAVIFQAAARDEHIRAVLWHGAGDSSCVGNDIEDFQKNPPGSRDSPQAQLMNVLIDFDKPIVAAVHGAAIGGGTTKLTHCDFVYAGTSTRFQMPFVNLAVTPEFGSSWSVPAMIVYVQAAEMLLLGTPFDAHRACSLGFITQVVPDQDLLAAAADTAQKLTQMPIDALRACKRLMKRAFRDQLKAAVKAENEEFRALVQTDDAREAFAAFLERRPAHFAGA